MPRVVRHLTVAPLFLMLVVLLLVLSPVLLGLAAVLSLAVDRTWRPLRAVAFVLTYLAYDAATVLVGLGLWLRLDGRGMMRGEAMQTRHYALMQWLFAGLADSCGRILRVQFDVHGAEAVAALESLEQPLIVLSRHAGPGDSFLLVADLLARGRRPRIVLRSALQLDPGIDVLGNRLPFCWVAKRRGTSTDAAGRIATIAVEMDSRAALLLFPEGGNVTRERRIGSIRHLRRHGLRRRARQAADMQHLVAPRPTGVLAAVDAAPGAAVVFIAHTGLAGMDAGIFKRIPTNRTIRVQMWLAPAAHIPATDEGRVEWLFDWWQRLDEWVGNNQGGDASHSAVVSDLL